MGPGTVEQVTKEDSSTWIIHRNEKSNMSNKLLSFKEDKFVAKLDVMHYKCLSEENKKSNDRVNSDIDENIINL